MVVENDNGLIPRLLKSTGRHFAQIRDSAIPMVFMVKRH